METRGRGYTIDKEADAPKAFLGDFTAEKFMEVKERVAQLEDKVKKQGDLIKGINMQLGRLKKSKEEHKHITIETNKEPGGGENIG